MAPVYYNRSNNDVIYIKSVTGPLPVEYFDLSEEYDEEEIEAPMNHFVVDIHDDDFSTDEETDSSSDEESDSDEDDETVSSNEDDETVASNDESVESPYTNHIMNQLNVKRYAIGSRQHNHLVYQSEICGLIDDIGHSVDRIMMSNERIHGHDAVRWLETLNRCRCCDEHSEMRKRIACRYVEDCDCECSSIYEDISNLLVRNND
tara:strand:- start:1307 stop:1921 length:615 start_codon:yes stop_codon:yes gene_type:complete